MFEQLWSRLKSILSDKVLSNMHENGISYRKGLLNQVASGNLV